MRRHLYVCVYVFVCVFVCFTSVLHLIALTTLTPHMHMHMHMHTHTCTCMKVWQNVFQDSAQTVYTFLFWLVEQARKTPKQMPLMDLQRSLNRLILFQVSHIPTTEVEQKAFMDILCMYSSQAHVIFDETNVEDQFLECLTYCLLKIALYEKYLAKNPLLVKMDSMNGEGASKAVDTSTLHGKVPSGYVPGSLAMMKSGANRLWTKMLEYKKADLDRLLQVELPSPGDNHHNREALVGHQIPRQSFSTGNKTFLRHVYPVVKCCCLPFCCFVVVVVVVYLFVGFFVVVVYPLFLFFYYCLPCC